MAEAAETMEQQTGMRRSTADRESVTHHRRRQVQSYQTDGSTTQSVKRMAKRGQPARSLP